MTISLKDIVKRVIDKTPNHDLIEVNRSQNEDGTDISLRDISTKATKKIFVSGEMVSSNPTEIIERKIQEACNKFRSGEQEEVEILF